MGTPNTDYLELEITYHLHYIIVNDLYIGIYLCSSNYLQDQPRS